MSHLSCFSTFLSFFVCLFTAVPGVFQEDGLKKQSVQQMNSPKSKVTFVLHSLSQCTLCFLFLCFLSFFLLAHFTQNHCWSSGGAETIPTQGQWYQSSQSSHPIMGLPSSGLLQPGQIQTLFPHSSRTTYVLTVSVTTLRTHVLPEDAGDSMAGGGLSGGRWDAGDANEGIGGRMGGGGGS